MIAKRDLRTRSTAGRAVARVHRVGAPMRMLAAWMLTADAAWLLYTRLYFWLHPKGLTFAPSPLMYLTGRPDPFCGLTRTFAWMWRGDLGRAVAVYPLGPLAFGASFLVLTYAAAVLVSGRGIRLEVPRALPQALVAATLLVALALNWAAKLIWLGM